MSRGMFFCGTVHLLITVTKLRSDAGPGCHQLKTWTAICASLCRHLTCRLWFGLVYPPDRQGISPEIEKSERLFFCGTVHLLIMTITKLRSDAGPGCRQVETLTAIYASLCRHLTCRLWFGLVCPPDRQGAPRNCYRKVGKCCQSPRHLVEILLLIV